MSLMSLRDFVPAKVVPGALLVTGMGDFLGAQVAPGFLLTPGLNSLVPSSPTGLAIQPNSVIGAWNGAGMSGLGCGGSKKDDCGCGCGGGMGQISLTSISAPFTTAFADVQAAISGGTLSPITMTDWAVIAGSAWGFWYLLLRKK